MAHSTKYNLFWIIVLHPTHLPPVTAHQEYTRTPLCSQEALILITLSGFISTINIQYIFNETHNGGKNTNIEYRKRKWWFGRYGVNKEGRKGSRNKGWGSCSTVTWSYDSWQMPGAAEEGCMQIRQSTGQGKNVKRDSKKERTERDRERSQRREKHRKRQRAQKKQTKAEWHQFRCSKHSGARGNTVIGNMKTIDR